jgi:Cdc6-like AAA superfamily ATPase
VSVYSAGEVETVEDGKVVRRTKLKFVLKYKDVVKECVSASNDLNVDCGLTVKEVAKATHYSISYRELWEAINELRGKFVKEEAVSLVDYVRQKYPKEWEELKRDPINWFLRQSERWHVGDDEVKLLTLIAVKSAFYEGLPKVGVLVLGSSGAGKSSAVKSILNMFTLKEGQGAVLWVSNLTKKALGYLAFNDGGKLLKNRCLFIVETIDVEAFKELSMLMTEGRLANLTAKLGDEVGTAYGVVESPPSVVSTAVNIDYNNDQVTQIMSRFLTVAIDLESRNAEKIYEKIAERDDVAFEYDPVTKYLAIAWMHYTPKRVTLPKEIAMRFKNVITEYNQYAFRVYEQGLKVLKIFASLLGKETVDEEVYQLFARKLVRYFVVSAVGLTSVELKALQATTDEFELTKNIADRLRVDVETAKAWLYNLARKGLVDHEREGNRNKWKRNAFGQKMLELIIDGYKPDNGTGDNLKRKDAIEVKDEKGETVALLDPKFRPNDE